FVIENGDLTLGELSEKLSAFPAKPSEVLTGAAERLAGLKGEGAGSLGEGRELLARPPLAANHHGFDTHPEMVQGSLLLGLNGLISKANKPVVILASSAVPLNNPTAPGGLLAGRRGASWRRRQARLFSRKFDHVMVCRAPAVTRQMAEDFIKRLRGQEGWTEEERQRGEKFAEKFLLSPEFLEKSSFLAQASFLASWAWASRLGFEGPPLVHLDLESLVSICLAADLADCFSPVHRALFHGPSRLALAKALSGRRGAWTGDLAGAPGESGESRARGTFLFWELSNKGEGSPLKLESRRGRDYLAGASLELPLSPEPIATALAEGRLLPGLFLDYLVLSVHGLVPHGGVFMIDYLPDLLGPASEILETPLGLKGLGPQAEPLLGAGLLPLGAPASGAPGGWAAAGALELMGPLDEEFFRRLARVRLDDLRAFTFGEWYQEETPPSLRLEGWEEGLGAAPMRAPA
ncbi:MAG: hypothetical protein LBE49_01245, partial [Deltaproteobacteria bacterium]|nr:hypothetical protein [Deltaproteobacteria bacterium]